MGITSEQEHRGITVQQGGVKVRKLPALLKTRTKGALHSGLFIISTIAVIATKWLYMITMFATIFDIELKSISAIFVASIATIAEEFFHMIVAIIWKPAWRRIGLYTVHDLVNFK